MKKLFATLLLTALGLSPVAAQYDESYMFVVNTVIPDNSSSGLADQRTIGTPIHDIQNVEITLNISGGYNGDYFAYLRHNDGSNTGFAILLNRVGSTTGNGFGYTDTGFTNVTFSGSALNDIHNYQMFMNPGGAALNGGTWAVDGRNIDPGLVVDSDPRTAFLSSFNGLDANGSWTLFIADLGAAGQGTLVSWTLRIQGVPEPGTYAVGLLAGALGMWQLRRRR